MGQPDVRTYALCLSDRPDRRVAVERELTRAGLEYTVFEATRPTEPLGFSSPGRRGCFESHLAIIRQARDEGAKAVVICQDDLWIARSFRRVWPSILQTLTTTEWQFVNLGYMRGFYPSTGAAVERIGPHVARLHATELLCAHFHAVHSSIFDDLIAYLEEILANGPHRPYDGSLNDFRRARGHFPLVAIPNLGEQKPSPSNITPQSIAVKRLLHGHPAFRPALACWKMARRGWFETTSWADGKHVRYTDTDTNPESALQPIHETTSRQMAEAQAWARRTPLHWAH